MKRHTEIFTALFMALIIMPCLGTPAAGLDFAQASQETLAENPATVALLTPPQPAEINVANLTENIPIPQTQNPELEKKAKAKKGPCTVVYGKGVGTYDANGKCKLTACNDNNYTLNETKNKCELKTTETIRDKRETNEKDKTACEENGAKWNSIKNTCDCDSPKHWDSSDPKKCVDYNTDETCTDEKNHVKSGTWDETSKACKPSECADGYKLKDGKCITEKKAERQETREQNATDKECIKDIEKLIDAYNTVTNKIITACHKDGKSIKNGECQ